MKNQKDITPKSNLKKVFFFISEAGALMQIPRSHNKQLINTFDTVASHSHHCAIIGYCISRLEGLHHEEGLKVMAMLVLHDFPEARTGDLNYIEKHYAKTNEEKAIEHQLKDLPFAKELKDIFDEYENRETLASKCAKDADSLEQLYQEWILSHMGNKMAEKWMATDYKNRVPGLRTKSAKKLALLMKKSHPHQWWFEDLVDQNLNEEFLNGKR